MKKICFVVQRYGLEINGGAELHCRQLAEKLVPYYDVTVLTTKAIDYITWKNEYKKDIEILNGVKVIRFGVEKERNINRFNAINQEFYNGFITTEEQEQKWIDEQGPFVPQLIEYLKNHKDDYDIFIFFTYLYYQTVMGVNEVCEKAIVIPTAHDEPFLRMKMYESVFCKPRAIFYNTEEERNLIETKFCNSEIKNDLGGVGVDLPDTIDDTAFKEKYNLFDDYMIYVGRIDEGKKCNILFDYFKEYKKRNSNNIKLVLMGKPVIDIPKDENIISLGFVSDEDKFNGIAGAKFLILPSEFESLSMVVLESMSLKTPVLVNGTCEVLKGHCTKSNGGLYYTNYFEFEGCMNYLLTHPSECRMMGENGAEYVESNYRWEVIINRLKQLINYVIEGVE